MTTATATIGDLPREVVAMVLEMMWDSLLGPFWVRRAAAVCRLWRDDSGDTTTRSMGGASGTLLL
jgi:hypothetical protein